MGETRGGVRLVASDLDGTLVRSDGTISARTRRALAAVEDAGLTLVLVTGRPPRWMAPVVEATGHRGLAICANGGLVYDLETEQVVEEHMLGPDAAAALVAALRQELPGVAFATESGLAFSREAAYRLTHDPPEGSRVADADELVALPVAKLLIRHPGVDFDRLREAALRHAGDTATVTHSTGDLLEVSGAEVSKAFALERLAAERGVGADQALAFGDMPNDLLMLRWAGRAVAVANAHPDVLAAADEVTVSNDEDGVALVLERLLDPLLDPLLDEAAGYRGPPGPTCSRCEHSRSRPSRQRSHRCP